jgi:hypothetical protein
VTKYYQVLFGNVAGHKEWITYPDYAGVGDDYTALFTPFYSLLAGETSTEDLVVKLWFNSGAGGGTRQKGDGDRYCDMRGTGSGERPNDTFWGQISKLILDDYVWMAKDGTLILYGNYHSPPYWLQYGIIYTPGSSLMVGHTRKDLFLADRESSPHIQILLGNFANTG